MKLNKVLMHLGKILKLYNNNHKNLLYNKIHKHNYNKNNYNNLKLTIKIQFRTNLKLIKKNNKYLNNYNNSKNALRYRKL